MKKNEIATKKLGNIDSLIEAIEAWATANDNPSSGIWITYEKEKVLRHVKKIWAETITNIPIQYFPWIDNFVLTVVSRVRDKNE